MAKEHIKLINGFLDETPNGEIVARGILDPKSLNLIATDSYQREVLPINSNNSLIKAFMDDGKIPDVCLGMRGGNYTEREDCLYLHDNVNVIDGLQRISTAMHLMRLGQKTNPHLGAVVYFNTTRESEMELFSILNTRHQRLSANVLVRNLREENTAVSMLYDLCLDKNFVLYNRVCWSQRMRRTDLVTAQILLKTNNMLHSTFGPGVSSSWHEAANGADRTIKTVGKANMRDNLKTYFEVIDAAWGIRSVAYKESAPYIRGNFLFSLAMVFANHKNFWNDNKRLNVPTDIRSKLRLFAVNDPQVKMLSSSGGLSRQHLYQLLVDHVNSGKRTKRLTPFKEVDSYPILPVAPPMTAPEEHDDTMMETA